jgi:Tol biopolymer transport system component
MKKFLLVFSAIATALWLPASARRAATPLESAALAWERGDYVAALTAYLQILDSPGAAAALDTIALQTGELYHTTELTADGSAPQFSPDGAYVAYETGIGAARRTRILRSDRVNEPVEELPGYGAAFSPDGSKVVYFRIIPADESRAAQLALDNAAPADRAQRSLALNQLLATQSQVVVHDIQSGRDTTLDTGTLRKTAVLFGANNTIVLAGVATEGGGEQLFEMAEGRAPVVRTTGPDKVLQRINASGTALIFTNRLAGTGRGGAAADSNFGVVSLADGRITVVSGSAPAFSRDGASLTYVAHDGAKNRLLVAPANDPGNPTVVRTGPERIEAPALSPDGARIAFQLMPNDDWEIFVVNRDGTGETRVTREIQHDVAPVFLNADRVLAAMGEPRHRRSFLYELPAATRTRLFHNNTVRTIAPEYSWTPSPDGSRILIAAERDGDTVSPQRGVYLLDLNRRVNLAELRARVRTNLSAEQSLVTRGRKMYAPIAADVKRIVDAASVDRIYGYEKALFDFDSKHVTQPGNKKAAAFLYDTYKSFGYQPEYQPFDYRLRDGSAGQTANVIATLKGTVNPDLVYVVSSHYDSVAVGPGADDDSSGTAALLEAARILAGHPQPATIVFASFTGEEAGLLGSREFVRRAVADKLKVAGALNNDMIGWANDARLDNTIRYSNAGIRDIQHAAAMQFSQLITYDALYYKNTDAAAYYEAYGDIVGGIGSYPVLGNPHYHQPHDLLEGINHQLVCEVARTTAATLVLLASSPSRLKGLEVNSFRNNVASTKWSASPEQGVTGYIVAYGPSSNPEARQLRVAGPSATLTGIVPGTMVSVKAINARGLEGWDWARLQVR